MERKKNTLIIGANGGIGRAILKELYENGGHKIIGTSTNSQALAELKSEFSEIETLEFDHVARNEKDFVTKVCEIFGQNGGIDSIIMASGITSDCLCMRLEDSLWDKTIDVNLSSCFRLIKCAYRKMNPGGAIVVLSSVIARMGNIGQVAYAASKGGLEGMVRTLAREFAGKNITVNAVAPGWVETKMTETFDKEAFSKMVPLGRFAKPEEIAFSVEFLVSEKARYITGHTLEINGGMWMI